VVNVTQRPRKIIFVTTGLRVGGAETMLTRLAMAQPGVADEITVVSLTPAEAYVGRLRARGITVLELRFDKLSAIPRGIFELAKLIAKSRPDIVQGWMYHGDLAALAALALSGWRRQTQLIWSIRCSDMDLRRYGVGLRFAVKACALLSAWPDLVIANSTAGLKSHLALGYHPRRAEVVANGIDVDAFRPDSAARHTVRMELGIPNDAIVLAHVARVDPMKDHHSFLSAMAELPELSALLIGAGTENLPSAPNLFPLGRRDDVARLLTAADFVVSSSRFGEGFSNALAEGMACGLPPIATDVGDARLLVGDTGLVVPRENPSALADAIRTLVRESATLRAERAVKARARIVENFPMPRAIARYTQLYMSVASPSIAEVPTTAQDRSTAAHSLPRRRVMFLYWGQRGAMSRFTLSLAETSKSMNQIDALISVSQENELFDKFKLADIKLFPIRTFTSRIGAITQAYRIVALRRSFAECLHAQRIEAIVVLMPHIWSPLISGIAKRMRIPYTVIVHDAMGHIGDPTALINHWLLYDAQRADRVVTLSRSVANELIASSSIPSERMSTLFLPNFYNRHESRPHRRNPSSPLRLLFFGRILPYKGLPLFVAALEKVRANGIPIEIGVYGEGKLGVEGQRLEALGAKIVNQWIPESEIDKIFSQYDALVLSHVEASQSGVVALAFGRGLPVVTTPVGGLTEQVVHEVNGLVADSVTSDALAAQIFRLATEPGLYGRLSETISRDFPQKSMRVFLERLMDCCFPFDR
jgi:glycosyltransferase involved in cell wall biosynthesis